MQDSGSKFTQGYGARIKAARFNSNLNQLQLAQRLSVTRQSISAYETERIFPSQKVLAELSVLLKTEPAWLVYGSTQHIPGAENSAPLKQEEALSPAQRTLIEYIKSSKDAADSLGQMLWNKALSVGDNLNE